MFSYTNILKQSLRITWKNKYLWFLGFFASSVGGFVTFHQTYNLSWENINSFLSQFFSFFSQNMVLALIYTCVFLIALALGIFLLWLAFSSYGALISEGKKYIKSKTKLNKINLKQAIKIGSKHFWKILGLDLILKVVGATLFMLPSLTISTYEMYPVFSVISTILVVIISAIFLILLFFTVKFAFRFVVLEKENFQTALKEGFELTYNKIWVNLEMGVIFFLLNLLMGVVITILLTLIFLTIMAGQFLFGSSWIFAIANVVIIAAIIILTLLIGAAFSTFKNIAWTNLYLEIRNKKASSKIKRVLSKK